jgi:hypothetical protein
MAFKSHMCHRFNEGFASNAKASWLRGLGGLGPLVRLTLLARLSCSVRAAERLGLS